jgi:polyisoprenoid-binding protein YceI
VHIAARPDGTGFFMVVNTNPETLNMQNDEKVIRWVAQPQQSEIVFEARHLMVSHVKGEFGQFEASVVTNGNDFSTSSITIKIFSKSVNTDDSKRNALLKGPDFLSADEHRQILFTSTSIQPTGSSRMVLHGDLKIGGVTRNVKFDMHMGLPAVDAWGDETACLIITGKLTRENWGLRWTTAMEAAGFLIGDELVIVCKLELYSVEQHDAKRTPDMVAETRTVAS